MRLADRLNAPRVLFRFHAVAVLVWALLIVPTVLVWKDSVLWVALMSIWANLVGHWSAWQAVRAEIASNGDDDEGKGGKDL